MRYSSTSKKSGMLLKRGKFLHRDGVFLLHKKSRYLVLEGPKLSCYKKVRSVVSRLSLLRPWRLLLRLHVLCRWFFVSGSLLDLDCRSSWADAYSFCFDVAVIGQRRCSVLLLPPFATASSV